MRAIITYLGLILLAVTGVGCRASSQESPLDAKVETAEMQSLDELRWKCRVLLLDGRGLAQSPSTLLNSRAAELADRRLAVYVRGEEGWRTHRGPRPTVSCGKKLDAYLQEHPKGALLLFGLDGGLKVREPSIDLDQVFGRIDAMPMRRDELRQRGQRE